MDLWRLPEVRGKAFGQLGTEKGYLLADGVGLLREHLPSLDRAAPPGVEAGARAQKVVSYPVLRSPRR